MHTLLPVLHVMGMMLLFFGSTYLMPIVSSLIYADGTLYDFLDGLGVCLGFGGLLALFTYRHRRELKPRDGFLLVTLAWVLMAAIATVPLMLTIDGLSFTDAFFETMSGLTTTGATVLTGLDALPPSVNLWRHELNWLGGMGIIVLAVGVLVWRARKVGAQTDQWIRMMVTLGVLATLVFGAMNTSNSPPKIGTGSPAWWSVRANYTISELASGMSGREAFALFSSMLDRIKYDSELEYWRYLVKRGGAEKDFGEPFEVVFGRWMRRRIEKLGVFLGLPEIGLAGDVDDWCASRSVVEIGAGPYPAVAAAIVAVPLVFVLKWVLWVPLEIFNRFYDGVRFVYSKILKVALDSGFGSLSRFNAA